MLDQLDKSKTYILGVVENTPLARRIQEERETSLPVVDRWTHCAAVYFNGNAWMVIEVRPSFGCHLMPFAEWIEVFADEHVQKVQAIATPLDITGMFTHLGKPFSYRFVVTWKNGIREPKPDRYVFCSEIIRRHDYGTLSSDPCDTLPADYQECALQREVPILHLWPEEEFSIPYRMRFMEGE